MALFDILTGGATEKVLIGTIALDATLGQTHGSTAEITQHKVESGGSTTDNYRKENDTLTLECFVTNAPVGKPESQADFVLELPTPLPYEVPSDLRSAFLPKSAFVQSLVGNITRTVDVYAELQRIMGEAELVTVVTKLRTYDDMGIASLSVPITSDTGDAIAFTCEFSQLRFATASAVDVPESVLEAANPKRETGKKGVKDTATSDQKSGLASAVDSAVATVRS